MAPLAKTIGWSMLAGSTIIGVYYEPNFILASLIVVSSIIGHLGYEAYSE